MSGKETKPYSLRNKIGLIGETLVLLLFIILPAHSSMYEIQVRMP